MKPESDQNIDLTEGIIKNSDVQTVCEKKMVECVLIDNEPTINIISAGIKKVIDCKKPIPEYMENNKNVQAALATQTKPDDDITQVEAVHTALEKAGAASGQAAMEEKGGEVSQLICSMARNKNSKYQIDVSIINKEDEKVILKIEIINYNTIEKYQVEPPRMPGDRVEHFIKNIDVGDNPEPTFKITGREIPDADIQNAIPEINEIKQNAPFSEYNLDENLAQIEKVYAAFKKMRLLYDQQLMEPESEENEEPDDESRQSPKIDSEISPKTLDNHCVKPPKKTTDNDIDEVEENPIPTKKAKIMIKPKSELQVDMHDRLVGFGETPLNESYRIGTDNVKNPADLNKANTSNSSNDDSDAKES